MPHVDRPSTTTQQRTHQVDELDVPLGREHDVLALDVPVHDPAAVEEGHALPQLVEVLPQRRLVRGRLQGACVCVWGSGLIDLIGRGDGDCRIASSRVD